MTASANHSPVATPAHRESGARFPNAGILIVDDHPAVRSELTRLLSTGTDVGPVRSAATASQALADATLFAPRVAVIDYRLPGRDGLSLTLELKRLPSAPGVVIYSAFTSARLALAATVAGADGLVEKGSGAARLRAAVDTVAAGSRAIPEIPAADLRTAAAGVAGEDLPMVRMLIDGAAPDEVTQRLGIGREWLDLRRWAVVQRLTDTDRAHGHPRPRGRR